MNLVSVAHYAGVIGFAVPLERPQLSDRLPDRRLSAMMKIQAVAELVHRRGGAKIVAHLVPQAERHHEGVARQVRDARGAGRGAGVGRRRLAASVGVQEISNVRSENAIESPPAARIDSVVLSGRVRTAERLLRRSELLAVGPDRRVAHALNVELPADGTGIQREPARRIRGTASHLLDDFSAPRVRSLDKVLVERPKRIPDRRRIVDANGVIEVRWSNVEMRANALDTIGIVNGGA